MQPVPATGRSGLRFLTGRSTNLFYFFLDFWSIFAKIQSRDTLLCMSNQFSSYLWQSLIPFALYEVKMNENPSERWEVNSAFSHSRMENMKWQLGMVVYHIFAAISHYSYCVLWSQVCFKDPSVFLLYSQRVTRVRSFYSSLYDIKLC